MERLLPYRVSPVGATEKFLPPGYRRCEYLQGTGTQYINTRYVPSEGLVYDFAYSEFVYKTGSGDFMIGTHDPTAPYHRTYVAHHYAGSVEVGFGDIFPNYTCAASGYHEITYCGLTAERYVTIDGKRYDQSDRTPILPTSPVGLFRCIGYYMNSAACKLYYANIYSPEGNPVREFVPALDTKGRPCMFDVIERKPYYNDGTGEFLYKLKEE